MKQGLHITIIIFFFKFRKKNSEIFLSVKTLKKNLLWIFEGMKKGVIYTAVHLRHRTRLKRLSPPGLPLTHFSPFIHLERASNKALFQLYFHLIKFFSR